jgi:hypothetical protein
MSAPEMSLSDWLSRLPAAEQQDYQALVARLQEVGDPEKLNPQERAALAEMANRYAAAGGAVIGGSAVGATPSPAAVAAARLNRAAPVTAAPGIQPISAAFLQTEFVAFVREVLNRDWCARGGTLQDAVLHSFEQKWLPDELRDEPTCAQLYRRYQRDIDQANGFRQGLAGNQQLVGDKRMAVGLAWFTTIYKMHQLLLQGIDPDS